MSPFPPSSAIRPCSASSSPSRPACRSRVRRRCSPRACSPAPGTSSLPLVVAVAVAAAVLGDTLGYWLGRRGGRAVLLRRGPLKAHRAARAGAQRALLRPPRAQDGLPRALRPRRADLRRDARGREPDAVAALRRLQRRGRRRPGRRPWRASRRSPAPRRPPRSAWWRSRPASAGALAVAIGLRRQRRRLGLRARRGVMAVARRTRPARHGPAAARPPRHGRRRARRGGAHRPAAPALLPVPFGPDEGGLSFIARQWGSGHGSLYGAYWLDRPPLLVALFKLAWPAGRSACARSARWRRRARRRDRRRSRTRLGGPASGARSPPSLAAVLASAVALAAVFTPAELLGSRARRRLGRLPRARAPPGAGRASSPPPARSPPPRC